jgi:hypothetical protein
LQANARQFAGFLDQGAAPTVPHHGIGALAGKEPHAAKVLGVTQARVSDPKRAKVDRFRMDLLVRLAARAGLKPKLKLAA